MDGRRRRLAERIGRRLLGAGADLDAVHRELLEGLTAALDLDSACWHACDPATGFPVTAAAAGDPPGSFEEALGYEFAAGEVGRFAELWGRGPALHALALATAGRPAESPRFREMIEPHGVADELRIALSDPFGHWSAAVLFSRRRLDEDDLELVRAVLPSATVAVRLAAAPLFVDGSAPAAPAVVVIDAEDRLRGADRVARELLARLGVGGDGELPGVLTFLAAKARGGDPLDPASGRTRTGDGAWLALDASLLGEGPGADVAVVLRAAPEHGTLDAVLRGFGLSEREREVAALAAQGKTDRAIAASLHLSPWTVSDHLKSAYEKTGAGGRGELAALAAAR
ncbi:MAG: hypothetical protein JST31_06975 [Actinobacteria bacterium]|nr:hypothetical protein [Actinomycetota bacterium]